MKKTLLLTSVLAVMGVTETMANTSRFCRIAKEKARQSRFSIKTKGKIGQGDDNKYFRGCRYDISWMQQARQVLCESNGSVNNIKVPEYFFFVFDGAADFSAGRAEAIMNIANLDGSEGDDLNRGNMNGGYFFLSQLKYQNMVDQENMQIHYHSSSGFHARENYSSAYACAKEMDMYLDELAKLKSDMKTPKFVSIGYSNGGVNATLLQKDMAKRAINRPVDLAFTVDPIAKTAFFLFKKGAKFQGRKDPKTKRFVNLYQDVDHGSLGNFKLHGKPVRDADVNIHVTNDNSPRSITSSGSIAHLRIMRSDIVENTFNCELAKLVKDQESISTSCLKDAFQSAHHDNNR